MLSLFVCQLPGPHDVVLGGLGDQEKDMNSLAHYGMSCLKLESWKPGK